MKYFDKMRGTSKRPPRVNLAEMIWSWIGGFLGMGSVTLIHYHLLGETDLIFVVGSFGASAVLIYGAIKSPLAQPRNFVGGHVISALIGVTFFKLLSPHMWLAASIAVATAIAIMHATKTLHPPGGATALIAVIGGEQVHNLGYLYALFPVGLGAVTMLLVALMINNIPESRRYPEFWL